MGEYSKVFITVVGSLPLSATLSRRLPAGAATLAGSGETELAQLLAERIIFPVCVCHKIRPIKAKPAVTVHKSVLGADCNDVRNENVVSPKGDHAADPALKA